MSGCKCRYGYMILMINGRIFSASGEWTVDTNRARATVNANEDRTSRVTTEPLVPNGKGPLYADCDFPFDAFPACAESAVIVLENGTTFVWTDVTVNIGAMGSREGIIGDCMVAGDNFTFYHDNDDTPGTSAISA